MLSVFSLKFVDALLLAFFQSHRIPMLKDLKSSVYNRSCLMLGVLSVYVALMFNFRKRNCAGSISILVLFCFLESEKKLFDEMPVFSQILEKRYFKTYMNACFFSKLM